MVERPGVITLKQLLQRTYANLNILQVRRAKQGAMPDLKLLNEIEDHQRAIELIEQALATPLTETGLKPLKEELRSLLVASNVEQIDLAEVKLEQPPLPFEPETILIPAGLFLMGSPAGPDVPEYETPQHEVDLPTYGIGKFPVTNAEYEAFARATGRVVAPELGWMGQMLPPEKRNHPVAGVNWNEALAYCVWLSHETGRNYGLPNEAQWEKAACGDNGRCYPWGDSWENGRCNYGGQDIAAVDAFPAQNSYGCYDMLGNVREWTCSLWGERLRQPEKRFQYPWQDDERNDLNANDQIRRVWRGAAYADGQHQLRCAARGALLPNSVGAPRKRMGFRVVMKLD